MTGKRPKRTTIAHPQPRSQRVQPLESERHISTGILEGLLAWWRTTPRDGADQPVVCSHGERTHGACEACGRDEHGGYEP